MKKKINLDGPDGLRYYWHDIRQDEQNVFSQNFGGGSVMVWAGFSKGDKTALAFLDGRQTAQDYQLMLEDNLLPYAPLIAGANWVFQQDNASIHSARSTKEWFDRWHINAIEWPARSPDLNPIENLWGIIVRTVYRDGRQYQNRNDLKSAILSAWNQIPLEQLERLVNSMPSRIFEIIQKNGGQTRF